MKTPAPSVLAPRLHFLPRFGLRTLLVAMTVACFVLAVFASDFWRARRARLLADRLRQQSRIPHLTLEPRTFEGLAGGGMPFRQQLGKWFEEPYLTERVLSMHVSQPVTDAELGEIAELLPPASLHIYDSQLTDAGMAYFGRMPRLNELWISGINVSTDGLAKLADVETLETLVLISDRVTDSTLKRVDELKSVRKLELVRTSITEAGLKHVARMPNLRHLFIASTPLSDAQVDEIANMKDLTRLDLCAVGWTDERLEKLAGLPKLTHLMLYNNSVTGDGVMQLAEMKQLEWFNLREQGVTPAEKARLKQAMPNCDINP